jgi:hypothetical protein
LVTLSLFIKDFEPFSGFVPKGFVVDFLGCRINAKFRQMWGVDPNSEGGTHISTTRPTVECGELFFERVSWFEAALAARGRYTMITLGALYGAQAIGAYRALQD